MSNERPFSDWEEDKVKLHDALEVAGMLRMLLQEYLGEWDIKEGITLPPQEADGTFIVRDNTSGAEYEVSVTKLSQKGASNE